jgi:putative endopeptidase
MAHAQSNAAPSPGFPVGLSGIDEQHAAFLGESRTSENVKGSVQETPSEPKAPQSFDMTAIDKTADPCTDFYQYACGNWQKNNPIPPDQVKWGEFTELRERTSWLLYKELEAAAQPNPTRTPLEQKYGDFYAACMDTALADKKGVSPLQPTLDAINALNDKKQLGALLGTLEIKDGTGGLFDFGVGQDQKDSTMQIAQADQGGLGLPDRDYYLAQTPRQQKIREEYVAHMTGTFELAGDTPEKAAREAQAVMAIETALAQGSMSRTDRRDPAKRYHMMPLADLEKLTPDFDWQSYLHGIDMGSFLTLDVVSPGFFTAMNAQITSQGLEAWKSYLRWRALHSAARWLSEPFVEENFKFYGTTLQGQQEITPRWKRCTLATDNALGEAIGQDWVKKYFSPEKKENMLKLVTALEAALQRDIEQLPWMSEETKKKAVEKLALIRNKIGYPEHWRDYSTLEVKRDDLLGNMNRATIFEDRRNLRKLGKPVDETEWQMTPPTVNAYYMPPMNDINFPAGILQPPFYDFSKDAAVNYGGIGVVIGHEMTHGFDDQGSKYDGRGNVVEWQTPADRKAFTERTDCEAKEYGNFEAVPGVKLNGNLTLGENTADNGGLRLAYMALTETLANPAGAPQIDGYTPAQRFFIAYGQLWCENVREESARNSALVDPHSPGRWRVNGAVQNFDEFGKAFSCKKGAPMYPENACRVW